LFTSAGIKIYCKNPNWYLTEGDDVFFCLASEGTLVVIISVTVSIRAILLEESRIVDRPVGRLASFWSTVISTTTILISVESTTSGVTSYDGPFAVGNLEFLRTTIKKVDGTLAFPAAVLATVTLSINRLQLQ
jgi:hypothetical protein